MKIFKKNYYIIVAACLESLIICLWMYLILRTSGYPGIILSSTRRGLLMNDCPEGWPLQVIRDGTYPAQVCRSNSSLHWQCAPRWRKLLKDPYCIFDYVANKTLSNKTKPQFGSDATNLKMTRVSHERKLMFLPVAQSGGTFIERSFLFENSQNQLGDHNNNQIFHSYRKFCMVRHPCSRLISFWKHLSENGSRVSTKPQQEVKMKHKSHKIDIFWEYFLTPGERLDAEDKLQPELPSQVDILFNRNERFEADRLLVYEKWNESIAFLGEKIGVDLQKLQLPDEILNEQPKCKDVYSPSAWSKLTTLYAMDFCVLGYSTDLRETYIAPPLDWTPRALTFRFTECKKIIENERMSTEKAQNTKIVNRTCNIYTYFRTFKFNNDTTDMKRSEDMVAVWRAVWSSAGWTPVVLAEEDAMKHPEYDKLRKKFSDLPTVNKKEYELVLFLRHVAMAVVGGGWLSDYDVLPLRLLPCIELPNNGAYTTHERFIPSLVSGNATEFVRVANLLANIDWQAQPNEFLHKGRPHVSDVMCTKSFLRNGLIQGMTSVIEAGMFFAKPFQCNRMSRTNRLLDRPYSPVAPGLSLLPWAIHFSYTSVRDMLSNNITFEGAPVGHGQNTIHIHPQYIMAAYNFIRESCHIYADRKVKSVTREEQSSS